MLAWGGTAPEGLVGIEQNPQKRLRDLAGPTAPTGSAGDALILPRKKPRSRWRRCDPDRCEALFHSAVPAGAALPASPDRQFQTLSYWINPTEII